MSWYIISFFGFILTSWIMFFILFSCTPVLTFSIDVVFILSIHVRRDANLEIRHNYGTSCWLSGIYIYQLLNLNWCHRKRVYYVTSDSTCTELNEKKTIYSPLYAMKSEWHCASQCIVNDVQASFYPNRIGLEYILEYFIWLINCSQMRCHICRIVQTYPGFSFHGFNLMSHWNIFWY